MAVFDSGIFDDSFDGGTYSGTLVESSFTVAATVLKVATPTFTLDAWIAGARVTRISRRVAVESDSNVLVTLVSRRVLVEVYYPFTLDALLVSAPEPRTIYVNAVIQATTVPTPFTIDYEWGLFAIREVHFPVEYHWGPGGSFRLDALVKALRTTWDPIFDLALGMPVAVNGSFSLNPWVIVDGNDSTYHQAAAYNGQWARVDLGRKVGVSRYRLKQGSYGQASGLYLEYSDDGTNFAIADTRTGLGLDQTFDIANSPRGRYWRVRVNPDSTGWSWQIYTLSLWVGNLPDPILLDAMVSNGHFTLDAWLWFGDADLQVAQSGFEAARSAIPVPLISQAGFEVAYEKSKGVFALDARLAIITHPESSFTVNARIHWQFTADAWLWSGDAGLRITQFGYERARSAIEPVVRLSQVGIEVARGVFPGIVPSQAGFEVAYEKPKGTFATNAVIYRPSDLMTPATFTLDAFKVFIIRLNAVISVPTTRSFAVDAAIVRDITGSFYLDADVQLGFLANAVIIVVQPAIFTLFAYKVVKTTGAGSFTLDAYKSRVFTIGAWITKPYPFVVDAAIIEEGKYLKSFYADAVVASFARAGEFILEAEIWNQRTVVYEGEGASHVDRNLITDRLSIPGFRSPVVDVNAIYGPFYPIDTFPVTVVMYDLQPAGDLIDDRSVGVHAANETNLWSWYTGPGTYTFWPSDYFIEHYVYTWPGPFNPSVTGSGMVSFYRDDTVIDALPAPTLDAWIVGTPGEPFTLDAEIVELEKRWSFLLDAELSRVGEKRGQVTLDAFVVGRVEGVFYAFAEIAALHFLAEAIIRVPSFTLDAHIHLVGGADATFVVDAVVKATMSWYPLAPAIDAVIVRHTNYASYALNAELVAVNDRRGLMRLDAVMVGTRPAKRFYLAAQIIPDVSFGVDAYIGHYLTVDAWVGSADGGMGSFFVGAYIRGSSIIIFPGDGGPPTDPLGGAPAIARKFRVKIEAFIPDPIPVGNDQEIENLIMKILEAEAELDSLYCAVEHYSSQGYPVAGGRNSYGGGYTGSLPNAISQVGYPGAGDVDDCWVVATVWAAIASGQTFQPTVTQFRAWAQNPDRPGATGGTLDHVMRGARGAWPGASIRRYASSDWNGFTSLLKAGWTASLAVRSSGLPSSYRYWFQGLHQVGVAYQNGTYVIMNPLQSNGSSPRTIDGYDLRTAARGFTGGTICACMFR